MTCLWVNSYPLLIDEGHLGCCQPDGPAAGTQQDGMALVPWQFVSMLTELTSSVDCPSITLTLLCGGPNFPRYKVFSLACYGQYPTRMHAFSDFLLQCLCEYWRKTQDSRTFWRKWGWAYGGRRQPGIQE